MVAVTVEFDCGCGGYQSHSQSHSQTTPFPLATSVDRLGLALYYKCMHDSIATWSLFCLVLTYFFRVRPQPIQQHCDLWTTNIISRAWRWL